MNKIKLYSFLIGTLVIFNGCAGFIATKPTNASNIQLPALFSDNMVLQRNSDIPIWGTATPNSQIDIHFNGQSKSASVSPNGDWMVHLSPLPAGGPCELTIIGKDTLNFFNVMVGEVWLCSGQSNMEMPVHHNWGHVNNYEHEIANSDYPNIRFFHVEHTTSNSPQNRINSSGWTICSPKTLPPFSATAYFFGRDLHKKLNVPMGLIHSSWGGTVIETWTEKKRSRTFQCLLNNYISLKMKLKILN